MTDPKRYPTAGLHPAHAEALEAKAKRLAGFLSGTLPLSTAEIASVVRLLLKANDVSFFRAVSERMGVTLASPGTWERVAEILEERAAFDAAVQAEVERRTKGATS